MILTGLDFSIGQPCYTRSTLPRCPPVLATATQRCWRLLGAAAAAAEAVASVLRGQVPPPSCTDVLVPTPAAPTVRVSGAFKRTRVLAAAPGSLSPSFSCYCQSSSSQHSSTPQVGRPFNALCQKTLSTFETFLCCSVFANCFVRIL